ncbi:MAG: hypothetical protein Q9170_007727 [Blastenia crenularia]
MFLKTIRDTGRGSNEPPPLGEGKSHRNFCSLLGEVCLCAKYCNALLEDLMIFLEAHNTKEPADRGAGLVLSQELQRVYDAMEGYKQIIFQPILHNARLRLGPAVEKYPEFRSGVQRLEHTIDSIHYQLRRLVDKQEAKATLEPIDKMPLRSPWEAVSVCIALVEVFFKNACTEPKSGLRSFKERLSSYLAATQKVADSRSKEEEGFHGGIPRMTFGAIRKTSREVDQTSRPVIVLGWTAPLWHHAKLKKWASQCRENDFSRFEPSGMTLQSFRSLRSNAVAPFAMMGSDRQVPQLIQVIRKFRSDDGLGDYGVGDPGIAVAFPGLESRARCFNCLCSTDFSVEAEDGQLESVIKKSKWTLEQLQAWGIACAEVEAYVAGFSIPH